MQLFWGSEEVNYNLKSQFLSFYLSRLFASGIGLDVHHWYQQSKAHFFLDPRWDSRRVYHFVHESEGNDENWKKNILKKMQHNRGNFQTTNIFCFPQSHDNLIQVWNEERIIQVNRYFTKQQKNILKRSFKLYN